MVDLFKKNINPKQVGKNLEKIHENSNRDSEPKTAYKVKNIL